MAEYSGTITTGGTANTNVVPANNSRTALIYQNNSSATLNFSASGTASATVGIAIPGGQNQIFQFPNDSNKNIPSGPISVFGANTGQAYYIYEA